jgi:hypothetical protein
MGFDWEDPEDDRRRRRETRNRIWASIGITAGILAIVAQACVTAHENAEREDFAHATRELQDLLQHDDLSVFKTPRERESPRLENAPAATAAQLESTTRAVCKRMLACGGRSAAEVDDQLDSCVEIQHQTATTSFARDLMVMANQRVLADCGALACDRFPSCYMDTLQQLAGNPKATKEVSPEVRTRFVALMCEVADENAGKMPDLHAANPSPKTAELSKLMKGLELATISELTKEALATCRPANDTGTP